MSVYSRISVVATLAIFTTLAQAQTPSARFETFLSNVSTGADAALEALFAGSKIAELQPQAWTTTKAQTKSALALYGKPLGYEKVSEKDLSPSLKRLIYLQKFEMYPVVWHIYFYRAKDDWVATTIIFNDNIAPLLMGF